MGVGGYGFAGVFEGPVSEEVDEVGFFGEGDELIGEDASDFGLVPSHEDFGASDGGVVIDEGLVFEGELAVVEGWGDELFDGVAAVGGGL